MESTRIEFSIENDALVRNTIKQQDNDDNLFLVKKDPIITKEVFIECYNRWIKGEENEDMA